MKVGDTVTTPEGVGRIERVITRGEARFPSRRYRVFVIRFPSGRSHAWAEDKVKREDRP